ncbi:pyruvate kinase [Botrimarina hoheduenensis]|uniref:Pyruvate kinase n=1 Tax=Botrimarina hoheduenensis TaxID=2528000 RepID=A0A5C5VTE8_9BACT|nr:pyruvate kinase [Botrimarina hoheduenensis]TWT41600.1 Pyruvate kinase [Botrimarina hoheduenensis]
MSTLLLEPIEAANRLLESGPSDPTADAPRLTMLTSAEIHGRARTKIVATIGPACSSPEMIRELAIAGVDVFRLNMAHGSIEEQQQHVESIRRISSEMEQPIAILVDLGGPKFRLGDVENDCVFCETDHEFFFVEGNQPAAANELTCTYKPLVRELSVGDMVMLADGTVSMRIVEKLTDRARARVVQRGNIRSRQGINLPGVKLSAPAISRRDHEHAEWAAQADVDFVSLSFVRKPDEVHALRDILRSNSSEAMVIAKIEKREALDRLDEIVAAADGVMVARGDLGVEIDVAEMPVEQKRIIRTCHRHHKPVIIATQMLDSMHDSLRPKRAEATDVANAILDGGDACMLSGETAIGNYPLETVRMMNRIALATEASVADRPPRAPDAVPIGKKLHEITSAVVSGAGTMAHTLRAKLVVVASFSGRTALGLSQLRSHVPTIGVSTSDRTLRKMCLYWGVTPLKGAPASDTPGLIRYMDSWARRQGFARAGDRIVIVGGSHLTTGGEESSPMKAGVHDIVIVHEVEAE